MAVVRNIVGTVAGIVVSQVAVIGSEFLDTTVYPPPAEFDTYDASQIAAWMANAPILAMLLVVSGWALGAFAGPWAALRINDRPWSGWTVTAVFFVGCVLSLSALPHPAWMAVCGVVLPLVCGWLAQRVHRKPFPGEALLG